MSAVYTFLTESTLGKLTKWLRLAGFDTLYDANRPDAGCLIARCQKQGRVLLTRTQRVFRATRGSGSLLITEDKPPEQFKQVLKALGITGRCLRPLTRCVLCNTLLIPLAKENARRAVADYVWQTHDVFHGCPACGRIFWPGTHSARIKTFLQTWTASRSASQAADSP